MSPITAPSPTAATPTSARRCRRTRRDGPRELPHDGHQPRPSRRPERVRREGARRGGRDHRPLPGRPGALGAAADAAPRAVRAGLRHARRHRVLRRHPGRHQGPGGRGRDVLHDVQAQPDRRVPRQRLHQHAVRHARRGRDLRRAEGRARRRQQPDHRRRQDHPRARRVPRRLRLRAGGHGQLRVLRQPDRRLGHRHRRRQLQTGSTPLPTRGAPLCTFKQISRQIAGFFDDEAATALEATATGVPTVVGVRLAEQRGETAPSYAVDDSSERTSPTPRPPPAGRRRARGRARTTPR